jgi:5-methylthioribose kinase
VIETPFAVPIGIYDDLAIDRQQLVDASYKMLEEKGSSHEWYCNVDSTFGTFRHIHTIEPFQKASRVIIDKATSFVREVGKSVDVGINSSWINIAKSLHYQERHNHISPNVSFVGVYYILVSI